MQTGCNADRQACRTVDGIEQLDNTEVVAAAELCKAVSLVANLQGEEYRNLFPPLNYYLAVAHITYRRLHIVVHSGLRTSNGLAYCRVRQLSCWQLVYM